MTQPFVRPGEPVAAPRTGGGKIAVDPPIVAPIPPQRHWAAIVFPIALVVGVVGFIIAMYVSGMRTFASGFGIFGGMMLIGMGGMLFRGRGAAQKMSWSQLEQYRRGYFARLDEVRDEVDVARRQQWEHRAHYHWEPDQLLGVAGSARMWERGPAHDEFAVVRVGVGKVELAMTIEKPKIPESSRIEPATGHALRKFLLEQQYIDGMAKVIWLPRFPGLSVVGEMDQARAVARAMICQLAAFHSPADVQIIVVTSAPTRWEWVKWLPHAQHRDERDGCGERRLVFSSPAELETFLDEAETPRGEWAAPVSGLRGGDTVVLPLRVIIDDHCGTPEDWAGLTGRQGYAGTCFLRLAPRPPAPPAMSVTPVGFGAAKTWVGFDPATTYRLVDGVLRKQMPPDDPALFGPPKGSDETHDEFYATADLMSTEAAERFARTLARYRAPGSGSVAATGDTESRSVPDVLGIRDPRRLDVDRLWAARRTQGRDWMRFPIGADSSGQIVELDLKEGSQGGMGMHSILIGTTGAGKSETIITEVTSLALTHSPEVVNVVFSDFKLKSAAGVLERFPHVVASVSNLAADQHLVGRMHEALDGELNRRGELCAALDDCPDLNAYNEKRLSDPSLPPVPVLFIICDEYQEMLGHPEWGDKYKELFWRIARLGRAYHMFLQLVGQTVDLQKLRNIRKLLGFTIAMRTGREEDSRDAIDSAIAAHLPEKGAEGTAYLRIAQQTPREFRTFFSSAEFVAPVDDGVLTPVRAGTWFDPRPFTAAPAADPDGRLVAPAEQAAVVAPVRPAERPAPGQRKVKVVDKVIESLQAAGVGPPRQLWLPPLETSAAADDLVARLRGKPWDVDYGDNPGLLLPVGIEDRPREHRQNVYCLNLLSDNALMVGAPQRGATTAMLTMITTGALMYRPERLQFYCIAASGPQLAGVADLPHVAGVAQLLDREGVNRLIATVQGIVAERETIFATRGLDMETVRRAKFGPSPVDVGVPGGDVVVIVDGWANFAEAFERHVDSIIGLMRARNFGVRVVITHTSYLTNLRQAIKPEARERLELVLTDWRESEMNRATAREVPDRPGRGVTRDGHHMLVGVPELANQPGGRVETRGIAEVVSAVAGVRKVATVRRLPESVPIGEVNALVEPGTAQELMPFGLSEATLGPAFVDFADHPHVAAVGNPGSGRTNFLRVMCRAIMARYSPAEAKLILIDPRRTLLGVVPEEQLGQYAYTNTHIKAVVKALCEELERRQPPPGTSQLELLTRRFWSGPRLFVVIDDASSWAPIDNPLTELASHVEQARETGLYVVAAASVHNWSHAAAGSTVLGRIASSLAPIVVLDGRREHGQIAGGVYAEPQRPGKGQYVTRSGVTGVLIGWSDPPRIPGAPAR